MESSGFERVLDADDIAAALAGHGFDAGRPREGAVVLALEHPLRIVWANREAVELFGTADAESLSAQVFAGRGRDGLSAAVRSLPSGEGARTERLRLFRGFRTRTLTVSVSRTRLGDGEDVFVLAVPATRSGDAGPPASAFALSALRAATPRPPLPAAPAEPEVPPAPPAPAADAGSLPAEPLTVPAALLTLGQRRFVWQTDAAGRLVSVSGAPAALDALAEPGASGDDALVDLAARLGADPDGLLRDALLSARPWRGVRLDWPAADGTAVVPVVLGAALALPAAAGFGGFRGFGVADFAAARAVAPSPPVAQPARPLAADPHPAPEPPADLTAADAPPGPPSSPVVEEEAHDPIADASPLRREPGPSPDAPAATDGNAAAAPAAPPPLSHANVVSLRPLPVGEGTSSGEAGAVSRRRADKDRPRPLAEAPEPSNLSSVEHFNFHEIGRALKGASGALEPGAMAQGTGAEGAAGLLAALPVGVLVIAGGRLAYANAAALALSGYATAEALEDAGGVSALLGGLDPGQLAGTSAERTFPLVDAAGRLQSVEGRAVPVAFAGAGALALTLRPATGGVREAERLEIELRRKEAEAGDARALLDQGTEVAGLVDGQGRLLALNRAGEALFGLRPGGGVGESVGSFLSPEAQSAALGAVLATNAAGPGAEPVSVAVTGRRGDAGLVPLTMTLRALRPGRIGIVLRDDSAVEALRRQVGLLRAELDHAAGLRADFLGRVAHEIRTPLNAILGFAEIILDERFGPVGNPRYKDYLADIHAAGGHVIDFVSDLFDLSKTEAGRLDLNVAAIDVNRIVSEAVSEMQAHANRERVIVRLSLTPHLPGALADESALRQIVSNLLSNAIAFNEPGGQAIVSTALTESDAVAIRVRDTGVGMTDLELAGAMEPLREMGMGRPGGGAGLGLPMTRALVEANGATMTIRSRKDEGTLVEVVLRPTPAERNAPAA